MRARRARRLSRGSIGLAGVAAFGLAACSTPGGAAERPWLDAALDTSRWLRSVAIETEAGLAWAPVPEESREPDRTLYAGSPGVVLFFLELAHAADSTPALETARAGADDLLANLPERVEGEAAGLYTGIAGAGFALGETWRATGDERYRAGLARCVELLHLRRSPATVRAKASRGIR